MSSSTDISSISWKEESFKTGFSTYSNSSATDNHIKEKISYFSLKDISSNRKKIILVAIIIILILVIIIMLATMIPLLAFNKTNGQSSVSAHSINTDHYTGMNVYFLVSIHQNIILRFRSESTSVSSTTITAYDVGDGGASGGSPCTSYTVVNDPLRNVNAPGLGGSCDNGDLFNTSIGGRWIRFMGIGGTMIPTTSQGLNHCGAYLAGWFNETLPSTVDMITNGTVCFDTLERNCGFIFFVSVVNCATFYVYFLPPLDVCNARYCTI
jgi:hypothetical protein